MTNPGYHDLVAAALADPNAAAGWQALAASLFDNGRDGEAAAVRVFWPTIGDGPSCGQVAGETPRFDRRSLAGGVGWERWQPAAAVDKPQPTSSSASPRSTRTFRPDL